MIMDRHVQKRHEVRWTRDARNRVDVIAVRLSPGPSTPGELSRDDEINAADLGILLGAVATARERRSRWKRRRGRTGLFECACPF